MEKAIKVVHINKAPYDVYIGRGSKWGNPYSHMQGTQAKFVVATREEAIAKYREYIMANTELFNQIPELKGKILGCHCKPAACHGDVLKELFYNYFNVEFELQP